MKLAIKIVIHKCSFVDRGQNHSFWTPGKGVVQDLNNNGTCSKECNTEMKSKPPLLDPRKMGYPRLWKNEKLAVKAEVHKWFVWTGVKTTSSGPPETGFSNITNKTNHSASCNTSRSTSRSTSRTTSRSTSRNTSRTTLS